MEITIPHKYTPRPYQEALYNCVSNGFKRAVAVWHRRAGKDKTIFNILIKEAFKRVGAYYYFFPTYAQGKKIIWDGMDKGGFPFLGHIPEVVRTSLYNTEMKIKLANGSLIQLVGSDNIDSIVGTNPIGCVFSEYSLQDPSGWAFVRPILSENGGWALFNFTPRGHNHAKDLFDMAVKNPEWFCEQLTVDDTAAITDDAINAERESGMSEDLIEQEYYCSFNAAIQGAYFSEQLAAMRKEGRIKTGIYDPELPVRTAWDLGMDDSTAIWFIQDAPDSIRLIGYEEGSGVGLSHYADEIKRIGDERGYKYDAHVGPHDVEVRELGTGKSRKDTAWEEYGLLFDVARRPKAKMDAIEATRTLLKRVWIDPELCERGIACLSSYHREFNSKNQAYGNSPVHDWASHGADALQTYAMWGGVEGRRLW